MADFPTLYVQGACVCRASCIQEECRERHREDRGTHAGRMISASMLTLEVQLEVLKLWSEVKEVAGRGLLKRARIVTRAALLDKGCTLTLRIAEVSSHDLRPRPRWAGSEPNGPNHMTLAPFVIICRLPRVSGLIRQCLACERERKERESQSQATMTMTASAGPWRCRGSQQ